MSIFSRESNIFGQAGKAEIPTTFSEGVKIEYERELLLTYDNGAESEYRVLDESIQMVSDKLGLELDHPTSYSVTSMPSPFNSKEKIQGKYATDKNDIYNAVMAARAQDPTNKELYDYPSNDKELKEIIAKSSFNTLTAQRVYQQSESASFATSAVGGLGAQFADTPMIGYLATIPLIFPFVGLLPTAAARITAFAVEGGIGGFAVEKIQQSKSKKFIKELNLSLDNPEIRQDIIDAGFDPDTLNITEKELETRLLYAWGAGALLGGGLASVGEAGGALLRKILSGDADTLRIVDDAYHQVTNVTPSSLAKKSTGQEAVNHIRKISQATDALTYKKTYVKKDPQPMNAIIETDDFISQLEINMLGEGKKFSKKEKRSINAILKEHNSDIEVHNSIVNAKHLEWDDEVGDWSLKIKEVQVDDIFANAKNVEESWNEVLKQKNITGKHDTKFIKDILKGLGVDDSVKYNNNLPKKPEERRLKILNDDAKVRLLSQLIKQKQLNEKTNIGRYMSMQKLATDFLEISFSRNVIPGNVVSTQRATFQGFMNRLDDPSLHKVKLSKLSENDMNNIVREIYGQSTGDSISQTMAKNLKLALEDARQLSNSLGANISKRTNYFPQNHNAIKIGQVSARDWADYVKTRLDVNSTAKNLEMDEKFFHADQSLNAAGHKDLDRILLETHERILIGDVKNPFKMLGDSTSSIRTRNNKQRMLIFNDADAYLQYSAKYGKNPLEAINGYFDHMANDISMMKVFGPNALQNAKGILKFAESFDAKVHGKTVKSGAFNRLMDHIQGTDSVVQSKRLGYIGTETRAALVAAQLGSAYIASLADIAFGWLTRSINGMEGTQTVQSYVKFLAGKKHLAREANVVGLEIGEELKHAARIHGETLGDGPFSWMANNLMNISLLQPGTIAGRTAFKYEFQIHLKKIAQKSYSSLDNKVLSMYKRYNITEADHKALSKTKLFNSRYDKKVDYLRVTDIEDDAIKQKFYTFMFAETEVAVPSYLGRARADMMQGTQPGTIFGEVARAGYLFKNFPMTIMYTHMARNMNQLSQNGLAGVAYTSQFLIATSVSGYLIMNARKVLQGEDTTTLNPGSMAQGLMYGGGFGIAGDLVLHDSNQFGQSPLGILAGPVPGLINDTASLMGLGRFQDALYRGDTGKGNFAGEAISFLDRYTPYNNLWYTRAAADRLIFNNLRQHLDVKYEDRKKRQARRLAKENRGKWMDEDDFKFKRFPKIQLFNWKNYE
tara:strand:+ start:6825 stop:10544 length:3720 start_codon:yes stop_codon:yes gene_type:complete